MTKNKPLQRTFITGDEWLYYKLYCGPKTADLILTELVKPLSEELLKTQVIDHWFFIRYNDPKSHLRVRFHFPQPQLMGKVMGMVVQGIRPLVNQDLVWKVMLDTYNREIERYGSLTMELGEQLFFHDSQMIVDMLALIEGDEGELIRWQFALRAVDALLEDFQYTPDQKLGLIELLKTHFGQEFGMNRNLKGQLDQKFRNNRQTINTVMDKAQDEQSEIKPLFDIIEARSQKNIPVAKKILKYTSKENPEKELNDLMGSYLHMLNNRLFKAKQRAHEMVLYDLLYRHYKSEIARQKYAKQSKKNKK